MTPVFVKLTRQRLVQGQLNTTHFDTDEKMLKRLKMMAVDHNDDAIFDRGWHVSSIDTLVRLEEEHHPINEHRPGYTLQRVVARVTETQNVAVGS